MAFRKRWSGNLSSSRTSSKIRVISNSRFAELKSFVDFSSETRVMIFNLWIYLIKNKEDSK